MSVEVGKKYRILEYPNSGSPDIHVVKVRRIFDNPQLGKIVEYRYNWPFPIDKHVTLGEFESWMATEVTTCKCPKGMKYHAISCPYKPEQEQ